jgi:hypothetical protein
MTLRTTGRFESILTVRRPLWASGEHQNEFHEHHLVTESWKLPVANHRQTIMRCDRVDVACAVRILGP